MRNSITKYSGLLLAVVATGPCRAQDGGGRSPILWASHIYVAQAQFVNCGDPAQEDAVTAPCEVSLLVVDTLKGAAQQQTTVSIHTELPRQTSGVTPDTGDPWGAVEVNAGDQLLLFAMADGKFDLQDRLFGEKLRLVMGGDSTLQEQEIADIRRSAGVLQSGDPGGAALQQLTSGADWGELFAQVAWEILEPRAAKDPVVFQQVFSGIENGGALPEGRAALVTDAFRYYIQIAPELDPAAAGAFVHSLVSVLASDSEKDRAVHAFVPVPLHFIFERNNQGESLATLAPDVRQRAASSLRRLGDDRSVEIAAYLTDGLQ
ncbi:MAG TPA: hypothetical protein VIY49_38335 [Bryobacteraceae bacterium]